MRTNTKRVRVSVFILSIAIVALPLLMNAQAPALVARYTATTVNVSGAGDAVRVELLKWSADTDRDQLLNAFLHPAPPPAPVVAQAPAAPPAAGGGGAPRGGGARGVGGAVPPAAGDAPAVAAGGAPPRGGGATPPRGGGARGAAPAAAGVPPAAPAAGAVAPALPPAAADAPPAAAAAAGARGAAAGRGAAGGGRGGNAPAAAAVEVVPETPESSLLAALQKSNSVGILWTSESAGYSIKYAYRIALPDGGERVIFATDRRLGNWSDQWWKPTGTAAATNLAFTVFEFRVPKIGDGEGRTTLTGKVVEDAMAKSIAVGGYAEQPVVFKAVKKVK